jgi:hypothetical protein
MPFPYSRGAAAGAVLSCLLGLGCGDAPFGDETGSRCVQDDGAVFLRSKLDDDDGDGNPKDDASCG